MAFDCVAFASVAFTNEVLVLFSEVKFVAFASVVFVLMIMPVALLDVAFDCVAFASVAFTNEVLVLFSEVTFVLKRR